MVYWEQGRKAKGALLGLTLATTPTDVVQAFMESIAYDHVNSLTLLAEEGVNVNRIRATGGGARSVWWTQLKTDLAGIPLEVVGQEEAGTFGAALLAGHAIGIYDDLEAVSKTFSGTIRVHKPDTDRARLHAKRLGLYRNFIGNLLSSEVFDHWQQ
jgi:xylulokinase